jgi:polyisoprenoid-binding protein YceI
MSAYVRSSYLRGLFAAVLILATSATVPSTGPASPPQSASPAQKARLVENYGKLPLSFEANTGQVDTSVKFLSRGTGYTLFLTGDEAVLAPRRSNGETRNSKFEIRKSKFENRDSKLETRKSKTETGDWKLESAAGIARPLMQSLAPAVRGSQSHTPNPAARASAVLRMRLLGANPAAKVGGENELPGKANYFIGNDPKKWRTNVPTYASVRYTDIYPGIDLVYHSNASADGQLEFDFAVVPGADPRPLRLRFAEPNRLHLASNGDLVVSTANGALAFRKPVVYQMVDGHRHTAAGGFALLGKHTVGFRHQTEPNRHTRHYSGELYPHRDRHLGQYQGHGHGRPDRAIDAASVDSRVEMRDNHLRSARLFDVTKYPTITFKSKRVEPEGKGKLKVTGDLTIHGVTKEVVLDVNGPSEPIKDPRGNSHMGASATTTIYRRDFGVGDVPSAVVADDVTVTIDMELVKPSAANR